jgi:protein involved in polysaccharide export with SLBB domain
VSRPAKEDRQERATAVVDFKKIFQTGDLTQNYLLEEGDIIEIPNSPLAAWDEKTRRVLGPIMGTTGVVSAGAQVASPTGQGVAGQ